MINREYNRRFCLCLIFLAFYDVFSGCFSLFSSDQEYELLLPDGLNQGQSISVRLFLLNELADYHYSQATLLELQKVTAEKLATEISQLEQFSRVALISENEKATTDLVLEGAFSQVQGGSSIRLRVSIAIRRVPSNETVFWAHCIYPRRGGYESSASMFEVLYRKPNMKGCVEIAKGIVKALIDSQQKSKSAKPITKW